MAQISNPDAHANQQRDNVGWEENLMEEDKENV